MNRSKNKKGSSPAAQQMAFNNALMADVRALRTELAKGGNARPSNVKRKGGRRGPGPQRRGGGVPAAVRTALAFVGMREKKGLCSSYTTGFIFVGNGTNGATNAVLFQTADSLQIVGNQFSAPIIPILPGDTVLSKSYMIDECKHYQRRRYKSVKLHIDSYQPNTNSALVLVVAPVRGSAQATATHPVPLATASATAASMDNARSMKGNIYLNSFDDVAKRTTLDLTPYIAGGAGPRQDEFAINAANGLSATAFAANSTVSATVGSVTQNSPCCFMIAGVNTIAGNQNSQVFELVVEIEYDLLDFVGSTSLPYPIG